MQVQIPTRDADGIARLVRVNTGGLGLTPDELRTLRNARFPEALQKLLAGGTTLLVVGFLAAIMVTTIGEAWMVWIAAAIAGLGMLLFLVGLGWIVHRWRRSGEGDLIAAGWLRIGRCPACGERLPAKQGEGAAVACGECGARWGGVSKEQMAKSNEQM